MSIKATAQRAVIVTLELDECAAHWLASMMVNPQAGESLTSIRWRGDMYCALKDAITAVTPPAYEWGSRDVITAGVGAQASAPRDKVPQRREDPMGFMPGEEPA